MGIAEGAAHADDAITEDDYFGTLPVVLTVSRLAQPISDTPGAVTVIDRDKIRRSGARDVTDLLRLVPGYLVSGWNGANPNAAYHAPAFISKMKITRKVIFSNLIKEYKK